MEDAQAGIFIQKITALNPRRVLLLNFTFLVRRRGPFHSASKKSIILRVRIALSIIRRNTSSRDMKWYNRERVQCAVERLNFQTYAFVRVNGFDDKKIGELRRVIVK